MTLPHQAKILAALLCITTLFVYFPVGQHGFMLLDTLGYYSMNSRVLEGLSIENVVWSFTTFSMGNWHPLTWLSYMLDASIFGDNPRGPHFTNLLFHILNAELLFAFLLSTTKKLGASAFVAFAFALHPTQVESVAWIAERKDVLFCFFFMIGLLQYQRYVFNSSGTQYSILVFIFFLGLMSKPMMVTFPFVLLLFDFWPLYRIRVGRDFTAGNFWQLIVEKAPLFLISLVLSYVTLKAQSDIGATTSGIGLSLFDRLSNGVVSYAAYFKHLIVPVRLSPFYPHPAQWPISVIISSTVLISAILFLGVYSFRKNQAILIGMLFFFGVLFPTIGLIQVGLQSYADRYTYVPYAGLFIAIGFGLDALRNQFPLRKYFLITVSTVLLIVFSTLTRQYLLTWKDNVSLWAHSLMSVDPNYLAVLSDSSVSFSEPQPTALSFPYIMMGISLINQGDFSYAALHLQHARRLGMINVQGWYWLGHALLATGDIDGGFESFSVFERLGPDEPYLLQKIHQLRLEHNRPKTDSESY